MFMRGLCPQIRRLLESQSFSTLGEVADAALEKEIEMSVNKDKKERQETFWSFQAAGIPAERAHRIWICRQLLQLREERTQVQGVSASQDRT
jgi:hypothetical protein